MDKVKESGFKRLLEAGAASVVMEAEFNLCTHAFVDTSHLKSLGNVRIQTHNHNVGNVVLFCKKILWQLFLWFSWSCSIHENFFPRTSRINVIINFKSVKFITTNITNSRKPQNFLALW